MFQNQNDCVRVEAAHVWLPGYEEASPFRRPDLMRPVPGKHTQPPASAGADASAADRPDNSNALSFPVIPGLPQQETPLPSGPLHPPRGMQRTSFPSSLSLLPSQTVAAGAAQLAVLRHLL